MDDELGAFGRCHPDLKHSASCIGSNQHREVIELKDTDWVSVRVEHVLVGHSVPASACQDNRVHLINISCINIS